MSVWRMPTLLPVALGALVMTGCGNEADKQADKAARWFEDTASMRPLPPGWHLGKVTANGAEGIEIEVTLDTPEQENAIRSVPQMQRFAAVQVACPKAEDEIWSMLGSEQKVWLNLTGPSGKRLTRGNCWRR